MYTPENLLKGINLETVTPGEALAFVQRLAAGTLDKMSSDYYVRRLQAAGMVAEAAMRNQQYPADSKDCLPVPAARSARYVLPFLGQGEIHLSRDVGHNLARDLRQAGKVAQLLKRLEQHGQGELLQLAGCCFVDERDFRR